MERKFLFFETDKEILFMFVREAIGDRLRKTLGFADLTAI
jgi:hypothetical protein